MTDTARTIARRALEIEQVADHPLYLFVLGAHEVLAIADISRVSRDNGGDLIGYQRPEVRRHIEEITEYLDSDGALFPNAIILALSSAVRFRKSRGPHINDGYASAGTIEIPLPAPGGRKPGWIVDGQQRATALARANRPDYPVPVAAFLADTVDLQRDQFLRVNNTKPLPRGLVTELLPQMTTPLPPRMAARKIPSALVDLLNWNEESPFYGLIRRASTRQADRKGAVVTDTSLVKAIEESLNSPSGTLFPFRNVASGETDIDGVWAVLLTYWSAVRSTFPEAWGLPATRSRLMHGVGIRAMGRLMDRIMPTIDAAAPDAIDQANAELAFVAPVCRWTSGTWETLGWEWNEPQNVARHINALSNFLIRHYVTARREKS